MFFPAPISIPPAWQSRYTWLRLALYGIIIVVTVVLALRVLFPLIDQGFDFRNPGSSKNTIRSPRGNTAPRTNGKIERNSTMVADTTVVGNFSLATVSASLAKDSPIPETLDFSLRRSYQSFLYPTGTPITDFPDNRAYLVSDGTYYALQDQVLYPYVSEQAFLSRAPKDRAFNYLHSGLAAIGNYPISDTWIGFRVGSLLGNATGVFVVVSETEVRPVGSAEIFLAMGYDFADVIPVSEEELGIYTRGRILLLGATHPDGTLLFDQDTDTYSLVEQGTKRPFSRPTRGDYLDFLTHDRRLHPVVASSKASAVSVSCSLLPNIFGSKYTCTTPITSLVPGYGNDFELRLGSPETNIDIDSLTLTFETAKNKQNMLTLLSQVKQRLLARFLP